MNKIDWGINFNMDLIKFFFNNPEIKGLIKVIILVGIAHFIYRAIDKVKNEIKDKKNNEK
mgnify:CR=1 FL=1